MLHRGVHPVLHNDVTNGGEGGSSDTVGGAIVLALEMGMIEPGDDVVCVTEEDDVRVGPMAVMKVARVPGGEVVAK